MTWTIAGVDVPVERDIELTAGTLSLSFEVAESELATWEALGDRAGDLAVETGFGGALRTLARGAGGTVVVDPDAGESPPVAAAEWFISGFNEDQLSPGRYRIELDLQRPSNRRDEFPLDERDVATLDGGFGNGFGEEFGSGPRSPLGLSLRAGSGVTFRLAPDQLGQIARDGQPSGATAALPLRVSDAQAAAIADAAGYPAGVVERAVPDGESVRVDQSGGRQTVILDTDEDVEVSSGEWLLADWSIAWNSHSPDRRWLAELSLAETAD